MTKFSLEKKDATPEYFFRNPNSLIYPVGQKIYAVLFFVKILNDIISIDTRVFEVKKNKNNTFNYKKNIITKNRIVPQKHSVKSLTNDMTHGKFSRIQLPTLTQTLDLIPGVSGGNGGNGGNGSVFFPIPTQDIDCSPCFMCLPCP